MGLPETFVPGFHDEAQVRKMKYNVFGGTGLMVSQLSIGTGGFCFLYGDYTVEQCRETLHKAVKAGVNFIDTAPYYGYGVSEEVLGQCLKGIPREAYYLATKVGRYEADPKVMFDFSAEKTRNSIDTSLKRLGVDYVDSLDTVINETLPVLEEAVKNGKAKFIGVTGYPVSTLSKCINESKVKIDTVLSYTRLSLLDSALRDYLCDFQSKNLGIINAAGHCLGLLTNGGPQPWHPATEKIKSVCAEAQEYCKSQQVELAKLAMHYCFQQPGPHTNLVGMNSVHLVDSNLDVLYNGLNKKEEEVLKYVQANIFNKLDKGDWEIEIEKYKQTLP
ncbi:hypothetical protein RN001_008513 [Aquatica leii]|uniref:NADP-dependent oxidoreductase domain-containing protein n=1 Tax=Aquatica leii TaxID=1421715 RepID=A0AAN7SGU4_9COLE|nr:hypothetical protein RN001_008513 [Aquatica leii]